MCLQWTLNKLAGCYCVDFHSLHVLQKIAWIFVDFRDGCFYTRLRNKLRALKKPLLDPSWLLFNRFSWISQILFYGFPLISRVGCLFTVKEQAVGPKETFAWFQLAAISLIFMDLIDLQKIYRFLWISRVDGRPTVKEQAGRPQETFARSQLAAVHRFSRISHIFMSFHGFHSMDFMGRVFTHG